MKIPHDRLTPETLRNLIEAFVGREGTDYGDREVTLATKIDQVLRRLERGEAFILFDADTETCNIATAQELREHARQPLPEARTIDRGDRQVERNYDDAMQADPPD